MSLREECARLGLDGLDGLDGAAPPKGAAATRRAKDALVRRLLDAHGGGEITRDVHLTLGVSEVESELRHAIVPGGVDVQKLEAAFDEMQSVFAPQQVDYSNTAYAKNHWKLSCFMEYTNGVAAGGIDLAAGQPMYRACAGILQDCDACFLKWYDQLHPRARDSTRTLTRMQSFVTRYLPTPDESHLPRHIDGADVDGSLVLGGYVISTDVHFDPRANCFLYHSSDGSGRDTYIVMDSE